MAALDDLTNAGLPVPSIYTSEAGSADKAYQDALNAIAQKQSGLAQKFGFQVQADPNSGALQDTRIDPTQQYSDVMNLLGSHAQALHALRENLAGAGLAGGGLKGLAAQRQALMRFQQQGQVAGLGKQFAGQYGDLENQKAGARSTRDQGYNTAAQDAVNYAIANGWFNQAAPVGAGGGGGNGAVQPVNSIGGSDVLPPNPPGQVRPPSGGGPLAASTIPNGGGFGNALGMAATPFQMPSSDAPVPAAAFQMNMPNASAGGNFWAPSLPVPTTTPRAQNPNALAQATSFMQANSGVAPRATSRSQASRNSF